MGSGVWKDWRKRGSGWPGQSLLLHPLGGAFFWTLCGGWRGHLRVRAGMGLSGGMRRFLVGMLGWPPGDGCGRRRYVSCGSPADLPGGPSRDDRPSGGNGCLPWPSAPGGVVGGHAWVLASSRVIFNLGPGATPSVVITPWMAVSGRVLLPCSWCSLVLSRRPFFAGFSGSGLPPPRGG